MHFKLPEAIEVLERTPGALTHLLSGLSNPWLACKEGDGTWSADDVINHLIENETSNWIPRLRCILQENDDRTLPPFDRFAHLKQPNHSSLEHRLMLFGEMRRQNIAQLQTMVTSDALLERTGLHPDFGEVKAHELLSTWVVHDLTHITQIVRVMAKRYRTDVGPWNAYLSILKP